MSTINKKAFISKVLESLTSEQLITLKGLVNGSTEPTFKSLINNAYGITTSDKGVKHIILETQRKTLSGYLIYNNTYCMIITYALNTQELSMFHILLNDQKVKPVSEYLDIDELRTLLDDSLINGKVEALSSTGLKREVVEALPTGSAIQTNVIYLVQDLTGESPNIYNEYMYIGGSWELLGTTATSGGGNAYKILYIDNSWNLNSLTETQCALLEDEALLYIHYNNSWYIKSGYSGSGDGQGGFIPSAINFMQTPILFQYYNSSSSFHQLTLSYLMGQQRMVASGTANISIPDIVENPTNLAANDTLLKGIKIGRWRYRILPEYPSTTGTYVLKLVNGTLTWVAE